MFMILITGIVFITCFIIFIYKIISMYNTYNLSKNNNFKLDFESIKNNNVYKKIKYKIPQQINIEGNIDINSIINDVKRLENEYNTLINSSNNNKETKINIEKYKKLNNNLKNDIEYLRKILSVKSKELDDYINNNNYSKFFNNIYSVI